jgi:hypothetical protein
MDMAPIRSRIPDSPTIIRRSSVETALEHFPISFLPIQGPVKTLMTRICESLRKAGPGKRVALPGPVQPEWRDADIEAPATRVSGQIR